MRLEKPASKDGRKRSNPAIHSNPTLDEKRICFIDVQIKLVQKRHVLCMQLMYCMEKAVSVWRYKVENIPLDQSGLVQEPLRLTATCHEKISAKREMQCNSQSSTAQHGGNVTHISRYSHK